MSEQKLSKQFRKQYPGYIEIINPKSINAGIPDALIVNRQLQIIFIEFKFYKTKFKKTKISLRSKQILWFLKYPALAFILIQVQNTYYLFDKHKIYLLKKTITWNNFYYTATFVTTSLQELISYLYDMKFTITQY
jgi:hypothetical protein